MNGRRLLVPPFLHRLDTYLRDNQPAIWRTRAHYILFYSLIPGNILLYTLGRLQSVGLSNFPTQQQILFYFLGLIVIIAVVLFILGYDQSRVRLWAPFPHKYLLTIGLYLLCMAAFYTNVMAYLAPVLNKMERVEAASDLGPIYQLYDRWQSCSGCSCQDTTIRRTAMNREEAEHMLGFVRELGYDTLEEKTCYNANMIVDYTNVYALSEEGDQNTVTSRFYAKLQSLRAIGRGAEGAYAQTYRRAFPQVFLVVSLVVSHLLYLVSRRRFRPGRREDRPGFVSRLLSWGWPGRLHRSFLIHFPWLASTQLLRGLLVVWFIGNVLAWIMGRLLPLRTGWLIDDAALVALIGLAWAGIGSLFLLRWTGILGRRNIGGRNWREHLFQSLAYLLMFFGLWTNSGVLVLTAAHRVDALASDEQILSDLQYYQSTFDGIHTSSSGEQELLYSLNGGDRNISSTYYIYTEFDYVRKNAILQLNNWWKQEADSQSFLQLVQEFIAELSISEYEASAPWSSSLDDRIGQLSYYLEDLRQLPDFAPGDTTVHSYLEQLDERFRTLQDSLREVIVEEQSEPWYLERDTLYMLKSGTPLSMELRDKLFRRANEWELRLETELSQIDRTVPSPAPSVVDSLTAIWNLKKEQIRRQQSQLGEMKAEMNKRNLYGLFVLGGERRSIEDSILVADYYDLYNKVDENLTSLQKMEVDSVYGTIFKSLEREELRLLLDAGQNPDWQAPENGYYLASILFDLDQQIEGRLATIYEGANLRVRQAVQNVDGGLTAEKGWLNFAEYPDDYFSTSLDILVHRYQQQRIEVTSQEAIVASTNDLLSRLLALRSRDISHMPISDWDLAEYLKQNEVQCEMVEEEEHRFHREDYEYLDFACRYRINDFGWVGAIGQFGNRLFYGEEDPLFYTEAGKFISVLAIMMEVKNFFYGYGAFYNISVFFFPALLLPVLLTFTCIAFSFFYFSAREVWLTVGILVILVIGVGFFGSSLGLPDSTLLYIFTGLSLLLIYRWFRPGLNRRAGSYLGLSWFLLSPFILFLFWVVVVDPNLQKAGLFLVTDDYSLQPEQPSYFRYVYGFAFLLYSLLVLLAGRYFTKQHYLPRG